MRKLFLIALSFSIIIISMSPCFSAVAKDIEEYHYKQESAELQSFAKEVYSFTSKYDFDLNDSHNSSDSSETGSFSILSSVEREIDYEFFETKRLIVYSDEIFDTYNAVDHISGYDNMHLLQFDSVEDTASAYESFIDNPQIDSVEIDYIVTLQEFNEEDEVESAPAFDYPHDTTIKPSWGYEQIRTYDAFKYILQHKALEDLPEIVIGIIDDGITTGNKYFDERLLAAYSFIGQSPYSSTASHGAKVAGVILENTLPNVKIISYRVFQNREGLNSLIRLAEKQAELDQVDIVNSSYGHKDLDGATSAYNFTDIQNSGYLQVAGAGNESSNDFHYPASYSSVISVASIKIDHKLATYSNRGAWVDVAAPGDDIYIPVINQEGQVQFFNGTSCATPFVASVCAMIMTQYPTFSNSQVADVLFKSCDKSDIQVCHGIVNMFNAVAYYDNNVRQTATPQFSLDTRPAINQFYSEKQYIELTCSDSDAEIYYTLDKTLPNRTNGFLYTEPIELSTTTTVSAVAYTEKYFKSEVSEKTYFIRAPLSDSPNENGWHIRDNGMIWGYSGPDIDLVVPETVLGIEVKGIERTAFREQSYINSVTMPESVAFIEGYAFCDCKSLVSLIAPGVTAIGESAFNGCHNLDNVYLPNLQIIERNAFRKAGALEGFPFEILKQIPTNAFYSSDIFKVNLTNALSIQGSAFAECHSLTEVSIPKIDTEAKLGYSVFRGCPMLEKIEFSENTLCIPAHTFDGCNFSSMDFFDRIDVIGNDAFANNVALTDIKMDNVTVIDSRAFENCTNLESAHFPKVQYIGYHTFRGCSSLSTLTLSENGCEIDSNAFEGCYNLKYLSINANETASICTDAFYDSGIERLEMNGNVYISSLPVIENSIIAIPSTATFYAEDTINRKYKIYGTKGTTAETFANENGHTFIELSQDTAILEDIPKEYNGNGQILSPDVIGFNRTYQWYSNTTDNNTTGKAIEGATSKTFNPADYPTAAYYYCEVTSKDGDFEEIIIRTSTCENRSITSDITKVEYIQQEDTHKDFTVTANGRKSMIQFIEPDGGTRTYDRYHKYVSITSYNADGEVVNDLSRDLAYEVWNIYSNMSVGNEIKVRGKVSGKWDIGKYKFTIEPYNPIVSMELSSTSGKLGPVPATVVADEKTEKVMFKMPDNTTVTVASKATDENGNKIFTGKAWMNKKGFNEIRILIYRNSVWRQVGTLEYTVE